uniref:VTT domain-containing protein n=1 Tax=Globisporangium ultimum (strain ATCC 200006 / CBS 805.95 / DAOM BR144) TaxID=431595 RepID=K3W7N9_GLOUD
MKFEQVRLPQLPSTIYTIVHARNQSSLASKLVRWTKLGALLIASSYVLYRVAAALPLKEYSNELTAWIAHNRVAGAIVFPLVYWLLIPLCLPASMFDLVGGSVFGIYYGIILNTIGKTGGALIAFALGKKIGRDKVGGYLAANFPTYAAVTKILQSDSWKPLFLVQLSSLPHAVKSYGLAITDVSTYRFMVSSVVTAFPFTIVLTQIGHQTQEMLSNSSAGSASGTTGNAAPPTSSDTQMIMFVVGMVCTLATMGFFVVYTKKEIEKQMSKVGATERRGSGCSLSRTCSYENDDCELDNDTMAESGAVQLLPMMEASSSSSDNLPKYRCCVV